MIRNVTRIQKVSAENKLQFVTFKKYANVAWLVLSNLLVSTKSSPHKTVIYDNISHTSITHQLQSDSLHEYHIQRTYNIYIITYNIYIYHTTYNNTPNCIRCYNDYLNYFILLRVLELLQ